MNSGRREHRVWAVLDGTEVVNLFVTEATVVDPPVPNAVPATLNMRGKFRSPRVGRFDLSNGRRGLGENGPEGRGLASAGVSDKVVDDATRPTDLE